MSAHLAQRRQGDDRRDDDAPADAWLTSATEGFVVHQIRRTVVRALKAPLPAKWTVAELTEGQNRLAHAAAKQRLQALEPPLCVLNANPAVDPPEAWTWEVLLPVRGQVVADELGEEIALDRTEGGTFLYATTTDGVPGLDRLYDFLFHRFLPRYKHRLTRPRIYHRVADGTAGKDPARLTIAVFVPVILALELGEFGPGASTAGA